MPKRGATTLKQKKVKKATAVSNKRVADFITRVMNKRTADSEYPGIVTHVLGGGRFEVKNLQNPSELENVKLSKSLYVNKRAAFNDHVKVGVKLGSVVLVEGGMITAVLSKFDFYLIKPLVGVDESASEEGFVFDADANSVVSGGRKTRKW